MTRSSSAQVVALWVATVISAVSIGSTGLAILFTTGEWNRLFASWGYPLWFMVAIGVTEVLGAAALFVRKIAWLGAFTLAAIMLGAYATLATHPGSHFFRGRQAPMGTTGPAVLFVLLVIIGTGRWRQTRRLKLSGQAPA